MGKEAPTPKDVSEKVTNRKLVTNDDPKGKDKTTPPETNSNEKIADGIAKSGSSSVQIVADAKKKATVQIVSDHEKKKSASSVAASLGSVEANDEIGRSAWTVAAALDTAEANDEKKNSASTVAASLDTETTNVTDNYEKTGNSPRAVPQDEPPLSRPTPGAFSVGGLASSPPQPQPSGDDDDDDDALLPLHSYVTQAHLVQDEDGLQQQLQEQTRELEELRRQQQETIEAVQVVVEDDDKQRTTVTTRESSKRWIIVIGLFVLLVVAVVVPLLLKKNSNNNNTEPLYWLQLGADILGETAVDRSGRSADLSANGDIVAIGAIGFNEYSGQLKVFEYNGTDWEQLGSTIVGEAPEDTLGFSGVVLSADGRIVAAGGPYKNDNRGHVRVFVYRDDWIQLGNTLDGTQVEQNFGYVVSMSADGYRLAAGSPSHDKDEESGLLLTGLVQVFRYDAGADLWMQVGQNLYGDAEDDELGYSVALSSNGTVLAAGAPYISDSAGLVRVWELHVGDDLSEEWKQLGRDVDGLEAVSVSGASIDLSSDGYTLAVGAPLGNGDGKEDAGRIRVLRYDPNENEWVQRGQSIAGEDPGDNAGEFSLSLSADGNTIAVGSYRNNHRANGAGQARVFEFVEANNRWEQVGEAIYGENEDDEHGTSVALSWDGKTLCVGSDLHDGNGEDSGYVQVFRAAT